MYGHGNYAPQVGQGHPTSTPPFQQRRPAPPPPPFQQGPAPRPPIIQQGPPSVPPHVGHQPPLVYQHASPVPVQQVQSYLIPTPLPPAPPQVHGSTPMAHSHPTAQQNSQWTQNVHHIPPPIPPHLGPHPTGPSCPELLRPPPPPRVLPHLPLQGQTIYRGPSHLQGLQHTLPPPPPPPSSSFFTPASFGSFVHSTPQDSHMPSMGPPPPPPPPSSPPGPPPLPPSSPPPTSPPPCSGTPSSTPLIAASDLPHHSESGSSSDKCTGFEVMASDSINKDLDPQQIIDDAHTHDDLTTHEGGTGCEVVSRMEDGLPAGENLKFDLSPPPPKPVEEKIVRKIEVLCRFIEKNGPGFEDMTRQKEFGNPEFEFLFGGEPGSEAAAAHEYFIWMKKKCVLAYNLREGHKHSNSPLRPSRIVSSIEPDSLMDADVSHSPADSDMDMEDDITQPDEELRIYNSFDCLNRKNVLISNELETQEQLHALQYAAEHGPAKDAVSENLCFSGSSGSVEQSAEGRPILSPVHDHSSSGWSFSKVDSSVMNPAGAAECSLDSNMEKYSIPPHEDLNPSNVSAAVAGINSEKVSTSQLIKGTSPFRLLQDYASDDSSENDDEHSLEEVSPVTVSPSVKAGATSFDGDRGYNLQTDLGSKSHSESEKGFGPFSESVVACSLSLPSKSMESSIESQRVAGETDMTPIATGTAGELLDNSQENQESINHGTSHKAFQQKSALGGGGVDAALESNKSRKEVAKYTSTLLKVDEFGRLVREDASDSDYDDSLYARRHGKRGRSWSRSRSPHDMRRRRRSPWRRKEKRSRSRSWSPKKRRSRSRSPPFRRGGEFAGDKMRRDRAQLPDCFDFLRGKCHRGALCRYLHHDSDKSDGSRRYKSKQQYQEVPPSANCDEETATVPLKKSVYEHDEVKSQEIQPFQNMPGSSFGASKDGNINEKNVIVSVRNGGQPLISDHDGESLFTDVAESERSRDFTAHVQETKDIKEELVQPTSHLPNYKSCFDIGETLQLVDGFPARLVTDANAEKLPGDASCGVPSSSDNSVIQQSQAHLSDPVLQNTDHQPQQMDSSSTSLASPVQTSTSIPNQLPISEPHPNHISSIQSYTGTSSMSKPFSSQIVAPKELSPPIPHHPPRSPLLLPSLSRGTNAPFAQQFPRDYNLLPPTAKFPLHSASTENCPPHQSSLPYLPSHFSVQPNSSWNWLPPPPPPPPYVNDSTVNVATGPLGVPSLQFQQNQLPPRNDFPSQTFVRPYPVEVPTHLQVGGFQHRTYPSMQEPDRPLSHMEDLRPRTLPVSNPMNQPFGDPGFVGEDRFTRLPGQGLVPSISYSQGNMHPQPVPFSRESPARRMQTFPVENLPPVELHTSSSQSHSYFQQPSFSLQRPATDSVSIHPGEPGNINSTMSRYTADFLDRNQPSRVSDFGGSRISNHYNPYASTFDQPLSSKFSLNVFNQEKDIPYGNKYGALFGLNQIPVDGQGIGSLISRNMTSSPNSAREQILPRSGGDQYDPLFDSIEPSLNSFKKSDHGKKGETTDDTDILLRLSGSHKPLDVEENKKQKDAEADAASTSLENDEYGETADAEVGAVENGSPSNEIDVANTATGEIEIDQVKTPGKNKKSKDSRSMKLFKVSLADFVKEVLKPSWRQGNMSKEAFKTIVKKTVDKVSGAMKSHQIPKSQAKINQYIDSSQRKLTKLVMGYVDKYVKV